MKSIPVLDEVGGYMNENWRIGIFIPIIIAVLCIISVVFINRTFMREEKRKPDIQGEQTDLFQAGYIEVKTDVLGVNPVTNRLVVELSFTPRKRFDAGGGILAVPLEVDVSDVNGDPISFLAGRIMSPHEAVVDMGEGEADNYPFDTHRALLQILVLEKNAQNKWVSAPAQLNFVGLHHGFVFQDKPLPPNSSGYIGFDLMLKRSPLVVWTAIFCMVIMWGLTLVNLFLLWAVLRGQMEVDLGLFGYMSGFLVAMYFFRQILPDIPPFIGVFADYLAFFWVEVIAAGISIIFAAIWFRKLMIEKSAHKE